MCKTAKNICYLMVFCLLNACSPKYDWREVKNIDPTFRIYFPAKPIQHSKSILLGDNKITMNMIAAEVNEVKFAVAYVKTDEQNRDKTLQLMQNGMIKNIKGNLSESKIKNTIFATGNLQNGKKIHLYAKFTILKDWAIQEVVIGEEKQLITENLEMFFDSFKLQ